MLELMNHEVLPASFSSSWIQNDVLKAAVKRCLNMHLNPVPVETLCVCPRVNRKGSEHLPWLRRLMQHLELVRFHEVKGI